jgi:hypothetical protein
MISKASKNGFCKLGGNRVKRKTWGDCHKADKLLRGAFYKDADRQNATLPRSRVALRQFSNLACFRMSLRKDRNWATKIYQERAVAIDADQNVTYFFLKDYEEICRYMRTIGYGSKGKAETVEQQVARELEIGRYCSLRTTVRARQSTQDIALFIYHDVSADLLGSGLVVVSFDTGGELAKEFADAWFKKADAFMKEGLSNKEDN